MSPESSGAREAHARTSHETPVCGQLSLTVALSGVAVASRGVAPDGAELAALGDDRTDTLA